MSWYWNPKSARYHWRNGSARFLARDDVLGYVQQSIDAGGQATDTLARLVSEGMLSPGDWREMMRREVKDEVLRQYMLGRGGRAMMEYTDWGRCGGVIADQYRYMEGFYEAVAAGDLSEAQIANRARMYVNSAREAFERANALSQVEAGNDEVLWVLYPPAEHCIDCEALAGLGWQKVADDPFDGAFPGSGATACLTSCACSLEYRKSEPESM